MDRAESVALLLIAAAMISIPALLIPDSSGAGTHEQLFVVPCIFHWLTGLPCPMCGMTTSLAHMARGEVAGAFAAHVLGPALYVGSWLVGLRAGWGLALGVPAVPGWLRGRRCSQVALATIAAGWLVNLLRAIDG
ncbi:MAG: DUF2752 domain-containing protein [Armatimonadota bacterium]